MTYNRAKLLKKCLESLKASLENSPSISSDIVIVVNGNCPSTDVLLKEYPFVHSHNLKNSVTPAKARNIAVSQVRGGWICFLDDDVEVPNHYFAQAQDFLLENKEYQIFGGPDLAPNQPTAFQEALALAQKTWLMSAHTRYRHGSINDSNVIISSTDQEFILCNLWIHSDVFKNSKILFPENYLRNEENVLLHQLGQKGYSFAFLPSLYVHHYKKDSFKQLFYAVFKSGSFRVKSFFDYPKSFHPLYLVPAFFIIYLAMIVYSEQALISTPLYLYLIISFLSSLVVTIENKKAYKIVGRVMIIQIFVNIVYGLGALAGLTKEIIRLIRREPN